LPLVAAGRAQPAYHATSADQATDLPLASPPASPVLRRRGTARVYRGSRPKEETLILAARIPTALRQRLRVHCIERGIVIRQFVEDALREWLAVQARKRPG